MPRDRAEIIARAGSWARRNVWTLGLLGLLVVFAAITRLLQPNYGAAAIQGLAISIVPIAFAAVAQAIVVISGGIDLSVGSMMALASVTSAANVARSTRRPPRSRSTRGPRLRSDASLAATSRR